MENVNNCQGSWPRINSKAIRDCRSTVFKCKACCVKYRALQFKASKIDQEENEDNRSPLPIISCA